MRQVGNFTLIDSSYQCDLFLFALNIKIVWINIIYDIFVHGISIKKGCLQKTIEINFPSLLVMIPYCKAKIE